jgi:hypothetical protein
MISKKIHADRIREIEPIRDQRRKAQDACDSQQHTSMQRTWMRARHKSHRSESAAFALLRGFSHTQNMKSMNQSSAGAPLLAAVARSGTSGKQKARNHPGFIAVVLFID